jgi:hypothetical protein
MAIHQIKQFLAQHKQAMATPGTKWPPIAWENNKLAAHEAYVNLVKTLELDQPKQLSKLYTKYIIACYDGLQAPDVILQPHITNLSRLEAGRGRQAYIEQLYNKSLQITKK